MIMIIDFLKCENIDIDSLIQQRLMVIIFNLLHLLHVLYLIMYQINHMLISKINLFKDL